MEKKYFVFSLARPEDRKTFVFMMGDPKTFEEAMSFVNESYVRPYGFELSQVYEESSKSEAKEVLRLLLQKYEALNM